jgi:UDP-glucuronate decarboxylase
MDYYRQHRLEIKIVRIFNTYGPRMLPNDGRVVSNFIVQALQNADITIYGDGSQTRSFCYVSDLIDGMVRMMETGHECIGPINLGNPQEYSMLELAEQIKHMTASKSRIVYLTIYQRPFHIQALARFLATFIPIAMYHKLEFLKKFAKS